MEELCARTGHPLPFPSRRRVGWHVPSRSECTEMIQSNHIDMRKESTETIDMKSEAGSTEGSPIVDGVAPQLPVLTEIVRRHTSDKSRAKPLVKHEQFRVRPHVA